MPTLKYQKPNSMDPKDVLQFKMEFNHTSEQITILEFLKRLMLELWSEEDGFDGKRPFGNSGWTWSVYTALVKHGALPGSLDSEGFLEMNFDEDGAKKYLLDVLIPTAFIK